MRRKKVGVQTEEADIDLTPMLDVVFIMLIFFIVTASFVKEKGIDVVKPPDSKNQNKKSKSILVRITQSGAIWVNRRRIDLRTVRANIEREHAENPEAPVVIAAEKGSRTGIMVAVLDASRLAGVTNISLASQDAQ